MDLTRRSFRICHVIAIACALVATGCFHHWVSVDDATSVSDDRVQVMHPDRSREELAHARSCGGTLLGVPIAPRATECDCATSCRVVDVAREHVRVRRVNVWATVGLYTGIAVVAFFGLVAFAGAAASVAGG